MGFHLAGKALILLLSCRSVCTSCASDISTLDSLPSEVSILREDRGWIEVPNNGPLRALAAGLRKRTAKTTFAVVKASAGSAAAATLAKAGAEKLDDDSVYLHIQPGSELPGATLSSMTQALAYKGIKETHEPVTRKTTNENTKRVQEAVRNTFSFHPQVLAIWKSIRHKDTSKNIRNFLWKTMHGAHRIGKYWAHPRE